MNYTSLLSRRVYSSRASRSFASRAAFERTPSIISVYATTADAWLVSFFMYLASASHEFYGK